MAVTAIKAALDDAGIAPGEVDGLASYTLERDVEVQVALNLGLGDVTWFSQIGYGGGAGCGGGGEAAMGVGARPCNIAPARGAPKPGAAPRRPPGAGGGRLPGGGQGGGPG